MMVSCDPDLWVKTIAIAWQKLRLNYLRVVKTLQ